MARIANRRAPGPGPIAVVKRPPGRPRKVRHLRDRTGNLYCSIRRVAGVKSTYDPTQATCLTCNAKKAEKEHEEWGLVPLVPEPVSVESAELPGAPVAPDAVPALGLVTRDDRMLRAENDLLRACLRCVWQWVDVPSEHPAYIHYGHIRGLLHGVPGLLGKRE